MNNKTIIEFGFRISIILHKILSLIRMGSWSHSLIVKYTIIKLQWGNNLALRNFTRGSFNYLDLFMFFFKSKCLGAGVIRTTHTYPHVKRIKIKIEIVIRNSRCFPNFRKSGVVSWKCLAELKSGGFNVEACGWLNLSH